MAKTTSIQVTSGTIGGRFDLRAKVAAGVVALGCAAALILGGLRASQAAQPQPRAADQSAPQSAATLDWEQAERAVVAPGPAPVDTSDWEQCERTAMAPGPVGPVLDWEQSERTTVAPGPAPLTLDWEQAERTQVAPGK